MTLNTKPLLITALAGTLLFGSAAFAAGQGHKPSRSSTGDSSTTLSATEISNLKFMREEEKLARDVYLTLNGYWGSQTQVFANIAESEERHTSSIEELLEKYGIEDPVVNDEIGVFVDMELQELYITLIARGTQSLIDGLYVGALIEEVDMEDIAAAINETDENAIIVVYNNLLDGSENHLRAFVDVIEKQGLDYAPQVLDAEVVESILEAESDSGRR